MCSVNNDFQDALKHMLNEKKEFDFSYIESGFWSNIIKAEQDAVNIRFDLENNEPIGDLKEIELPINYPSGKPVKVNAQLYSAGGDWEDSVGYFKCQMESGKYFLIHIPGPSVNTNLIKRDKGYGPTQEEDKVEEKPTKIKDIEKALWDDLKANLSDRLKGEADPDTWELDYKVARAYIRDPK